MVWVNIILALLLLPLLLIDVTGVWIAFLVLVASSCVQQLFQPAQVALVPRLIEDTDAETHSGQLAYRGLATPGAADRTGNWGRGVRGRGPAGGRARRCSLVPV